MTKWDIDYQSIDTVVNPDNSRVALKGNEHRFIRVAFDLFKSKDGDAEELWQIQADDDGNEFLVRTYSDGAEVEKTASDWAVFLDKRAENLTVAYKNTPIRRLAAVEWGAKSEKDVYLLKEALEGKLAKDSDFVNKFIDSLNSNQKEILLGIVRG